MLLGKTKNIAMLGIMAALSTVLAVLGTVISVNTVFFTAAAAFFVGIAVVKYGSASGILFFFVCSTLDFFVNPNKLHVLLYVVFAGYLLVAEISFRGLKKWKGKKKETIHRGIRLIVFLFLYVPGVIFLPELFVAGTVLEKWMSAGWFMTVLLLIGIPLWFIYDLAYFTGKRELLKIFRVAKSSNR